VPESQARTAELAPLLGAVPDSEPRPIDRPAPVARRLWGVQNVVVVHATIDEEGCVRDAEVEGTVLQPLEKTVLAAVGNWVFVPASENGKPVARPYSTKVRLSWTQRSDSTADLYRPIAATGTLYSLRVY
jgi:outer membrane biosynthesis protein TonB